MGQLVARGHELTAAARLMPTSSSSTPAASSIPPSRNRSTRFSRWRSTRRSGRAQKLIVAGCLVERYRDDIRKNIPEVDAVLGTNELDTIVALCEGVAMRRRRAQRQPLRAVPLSRPHAARAFHRAPLRLHQDRRRLRSSLLVLRDPPVPRQFSQPPFRIRDRRSHPHVRPGRPRDQSDRPGHHLLTAKISESKTACRICWRGWPRSRRRIPSGFASSTAIRTASRRSCSIPSPSIRRS